MVKFFYLLLFPTFVMAAEFTATVSRQTVSPGESFVLNLTLKDASPKGPPSINALKRIFVINSQQQGSNTTLFNGKRSDQTLWKFVLVPLKEDETEIPPISIDTSEGVLTSQAIPMHVVKGSDLKGTDSPSLLLKTEISNYKPYKNEPFIFTLKLIASQDVADVQMQKITLEDAILEAYEEPKIYQKMVDGTSRGIIEFNYIVTPLKQGTLKIPEIVIQGIMPIKGKLLFDDHFSPFDRTKPFALSTEEVTLQIQPSEMTPWVPAKSLKIEEVWNENQTLQVGEPITREFIISGEGIKASQLPSLQHESSSFKIYSDKPELKDAVVEGVIKSTRKEQYTLVPKQEGTLTLPEITFTWWDVTKKERSTLKVPSRVVEILPTVAITEKNVEVIVQRDPLPYFIIGGLVLFLGGIGFWALRLQRKISQMKPKKSLFELLHEAKTKCPDDLKEELLAIERELDQVLYKEGSSHDAVSKKLEHFLKKLKTKPPKKKKETLPDLNPT